MMRGLSSAGLLLATTLLLLSVEAAAATPQPHKVKQTTKPVSTLAMDGPRVAYVSAGRVRVWNVLTGTTSTVKGTYPSNGMHSGSRPAVLDEVAIAGTRVALITRFVAGNSQEAQERLYTGRLGGSAHQLGSTSTHVTGPQCFECGNPGFATGDWIAGVVGSGKMLAVSTWKSSDTVTSEERLSLVTPTGLRTIVTGPGAIVAESTAGGRIAVLRSTEAWPASDVGPATAAPSVGIYSSGGRLLREIVPSSAREVALSGKRLVVLTQPDVIALESEAEPFEFEVYDWRTGALVHTWGVPARPPQLAGCRRFALYGRLAVYSVGCGAGGAHTLRLLDVTSGKDVVLARVHGSGGPVLAMDAKGLVYGVNHEFHAKQPPHGKLVFVPRAKLLAKVS
jgi:hypothetical protein